MAQSDRQVDTAERGTGGEATVALLGDVYLGDPVVHELSPELRALLDNADLVIANQEGPITARHNPVDGKICLRAAPRAAGHLRDNGVDIVSLANNHVFDQGWDGFADTRAALDDAGIEHLGAGENLTVATRPLVVERGGLRIGLLAYSSAFVQTRCATESDYGCAPWEIELAERQVRELAERVDAVIVLPHWGYCGYKLPTPEQTAHANRLLAAGATAVVGSHSHVVQAVLQCQRRLIAYSLGNFAFATYQDRGAPARFTREDKAGMVLVLRLDRAGVSAFDVVHTRTVGERIEIDDSDRRRREIEARTKPLGAADYDREWKRYVRRRAVGRVLHYAMNLHRVRKESLQGGWLMLTSIFGRRSRPTRESSTDG